MSRLYLAQFGLFCFAAVSRYRASGMEAATGRRISGARQITFEQYAIASIKVGIRNRSRRDKSLGIGMKWFFIYFRTVAYFDYLAQIHNSDSVTDITHHIEVVGDEKIGQIELFL